MTKPTVLVLMGYDLAAIPVVRWLADDFQVLLVAARNATNQRHSDAFATACAAAAEWRWIDALFDDWQTVETALTWHRTYGIDHVVCLDEKGLIIAARLRALLGVRTGQGVASAHAYRYKDRMYRAAGQAVAVPRFVVAASSFEVADAAERLGLPVVVKPVDGSGSRDTHVLRDSAELLAWLRGRPIRRPEPVLVQRFVDGDMYHVDGVVAGGRTHGVRVSRYGGSTLGYKDSQALTSTMVDTGGKEFAVLSEQVARTVAALPDPADSVFHAEFFLTAAGDAYLCEIAARAGGGAIAPAYALSTGVDLFWAHALLQCGLVDEVLAAYDAPGTRGGRYGFLLENTPAGRLLWASSDCELPGVVRCDLLARPGQVYEGPASSADLLRQFVIEVHDDQDTADLYRRIDTWCHHNRAVA
ncbi:ATP-grasp domain-containing protein [Streptomyces sp. TLI_55]|uniref:ATP-grasp domain-containing protein n=1 Tax=Streptomyces sp. TLI_55 TaxID=1938861 RepID=UPI000BC82F79|nr:ATP-grasp domain-containing protein [Streptomyces sp. TLI_55]SNX88540.1 ATP-grasp domain-containing protein [Streptomyces sp. TLI_55]